MSTRATIRIKDGDDQILIYHHSDGGPACLGTKMKRYLANRETGCWDVEEIANDLVKNGVTYRGKDIFSGKEKMITDTGFEITTSIHGDKDFIYVIDCAEETIQCYHHKWDEGDACIKPERLIEIPEPKAEEA